MFVVLFLLVTFRTGAEESNHRPVPVSPGSGTEVVSVGRSCPTFSWSAVDQASSYRIAIFEVIEPKILEYEDMASIASPVISKDIPGPALSWTIPSEKSFNTGSMYAWYVQAVDAYGNALGNWSNGSIFKVEQEVRFAGIEERLAEKLRENGVSEETISNVLKDIRSEVKEVVVRSSGSHGNISNNPGISRVQGTEGFNTYYGVNAGRSNTSGYWNTFVGFNAGEANTTGYQNAFFGDAAGAYNIDGYHNTYIGQYAGIHNTSGNTNTFLGFSSGFRNVGGYGNNFFGANAGYSNLSGDNNTFIGEKAGYSNTFADGNIFIGEQAGYSNTNASGNIFMGEQAGYTNTAGVDNVFIGNLAGYKNTGGSSNLFFGDFSGYSNTIGEGNTYIGNGAGRSNSIGNNNVFLGSNAGYSNHFGQGNVCLGFSAGYNETGSNRLYVANSDTGSPLIYGEFDNGLVSINGKLGVGTKTPSGTFEIEQTGSDAVFIFDRTDGAQGRFSAFINKVAIGARSNHKLNIISNNIPIMTLTPGGYVGIGTASPSYPLHMASGAYCSTGGTWTNASSRSLKENIRDLPTAEAVETLNKLNPVKYNYKVDKTDKHVGFIAEDVPELVAAADRKGLSAMDVTAVLTKVVQEQQKIISDLRERLAKIEKER